MQALRAVGYGAVFRKLVGQLGHHLDQRRIVARLLPTVVGRAQDKAVEKLLRSKALTGLDTQCTRLDLGNIEICAGDNVFGLGVFDKQ